MGDAALRDVNLATVARVLASITAMDTSAVVADLHPDLVFELPYEKAVENMGRDGFLDMLNGLFGVYQRFTMTLVETIPAVDPSIVVVRYEGDCLSVDGSVTYRNSYVAILGFADGQIRSWREWDNPIVSRRMNERLAAVGPGLTSP